MTREPEDRFVGRLVRDLAPVRRVLPLGVAVGSAVAAGVVVGLAALAAGGVRPDLAARLGEVGRYGAVLAGLVVAAAGGVLAAIASGRPDRLGAARSGALVALAGLALGTLAALAGCLVADDAWRAFDAGIPLANDLRCFVRGVVLGAPPAAAAAVLALRGAPRRTLVTLALAALGGVALGSLAVHLGCPANGVRHVLAAHLGAPLAGGLALLALAAGIDRLRAPR